MEENFKIYNFHKYYFKYKISQIEMGWACSVNDVQYINPSAWGHLNPSSYCDVGRLFTGYLNYGLNCREKMKK